LIRQYELVERVRAYDPDVNEALLNQAYVFAMKAHGSQLRHSGDPYFVHPIEVAGILTNLKLDTATIATALLHDTIEDTLASPEDIEKAFGTEIFGLVDGVTKLSRLELVSERTRQAENFRKLLVAMSSDIRVLLVKLADRLHNMRTIHFIPNEAKRHRIAQETMDIYAPLAGRIGMQEIRDELEDLAFTVLQPEARASLIKRFEFLRSETGEIVQKVVDQLRRTLAENGIEAWVSGREKRPYSIWRKMESKAISFEQLSDVIGFRIVVDSVPSCYQALGIIHSTWKTVPGRFKDYISTPKRNGYRSIHTTVFGPQEQRVEMQIRTVEMHEVADKGVAAHWSYKEGKAGPLSEEARSFGWIQEIVSLLEHSGTAEEFLENTKLEMFHDQVFCFTPKGDLIGLPKGATPIDFAYAVHTSVGDTTVGAKINGKHMPLRTQLANGDQVEIIRSKAQTPPSTWDSIVVTGRARSAIRRFARQREKDEFARLGRKMLEQTFKGEGESFADKSLDGVLKRLKAHRAEDVFVMVGRGELRPADVFHTVYPDATPKPAPDPELPAKKAKAKKKTSGAIPIRGLSAGVAIHFAGCCHPLPGDRIVGIDTTGVGVTVHTIDCDTLAQFQEQPERWLDLAWEDEGDAAHMHVGRIKTVVTNEPGALAALTGMIAKYGGNITNLKITDRAHDFFEMIVDIEVTDVRHLTRIIQALRAAPLVSHVERT